MPTLFLFIQLCNRGPAPFHRLTPNKRFEPVFSTVIMAVCSLFNRMLLLTDLIPVHLVYCGQTVMIGCNRTSFEWTRAVRHIYGIIYALRRSRQNARYTQRRDTPFLSYCCSQNACFYADTEPIFCLLIQIISLILTINWLWFRYTVICKLVFTVLQSEIVGLCSYFRKLKVFRAYYFWHKWNLAQLVRTWNVFVFSSLFFLHNR